MRRFFLQPEALCHDSVVLPEEIRRHLRVLRLAPGERIELFDGQGQRVQARITRLEKTGGEAAVECRRQDPLPRLAVRLIQGLPKGSKLDLVLQKGTELGISRFSPVYCRHGDIVAPPQRRDGRRERWEKIIQEAARQSGRSHLPVLDQPVALDELLPRIDEDLRLVPWEQASEPLHNRLQGQAPRSIAFLIGPEGGLSADEVALAGRCGFVPVSLGPRILRSETAGIAVASILQYLFGDLGSHGDPPSAQDRHDPTPGSGSRNPSDKEGL